MTDPHVEDNPVPDADRIADSLDVAEASEGGVLLVDDNQQNLELLQAYIEDLGCRIRTATTGAEALAEIERLQPDIILLDVMMPRMSGFQVCSKVKADPATRDIPIVMVTALNEVSDVERAVESGADDFLTKPVHKIELVTRVRSLMKVRLLRRQLEQTLREMKDLKQERED